MCLCVYGGRNDDIFDKINNSALNDLNILNLVTLEWQEVAMYGKVPASRWAAQMCTSHYDIESRDNSILLVGGCSLDSYCKPTLTEFVVCGGYQKVQEENTYDLQLLRQRAEDEKDKKMGSENDFRCESFLTQTREFVN
jgi:hypothetical protein